MGAGKHSSDDAFSFDFAIFRRMKESISFMKILIVFTVLFVVVGGIFAVKMVLEKQNTQQPGGSEQVSSAVPTLESQYEGYEVLGKIKINKLNVEQYILNSADEDALEKGVTKLYGETLNHYGNFCIAGHNYENVFQRLNELEIGDCFTIIDKNLGETEYEIKEIISVEPDDLSCLLPTQDSTQITLITCENVSTTRLVVKAEKK